MQDRKRGVLAALGTYLLWGALPLYWSLLGGVGADEIIANRILWSLVFVCIALVLARKWQQFCADCRALWREKGRLGLLVAAAVLITANWLTYIWAVNNGHVIDTSIGYYINPLMSVLLGVAVFRERLTPTKKLSIALAAIGILLMTMQLGKLPWIAVALALTFAVYGAVKKKLHLDPFSSITLETLLMLPAALLYLAALAQQGALALGTEARTTILLIGTGIATAVPLILFSYGANLLPLNVLGFFQYISPTLALLLGIFFFGEPFGMAQLTAFAFIWLALILFTISERVRG